jgi:heme exporter protein D
MAQFFSMGGYAQWVWPAYGLATAVLLGILLFSLRTLKARQKEFDGLKSARRGGAEGGSQ